MKDSESLKKKQRFSTGLQALEHQKQIGIW